MTKQDKEKKVIPQRQSVHVVFFSCSNCGEEQDYIQFCPDCGKPMRVINVVEKFGNEAEEYIKKIEDRLAGGVHGKQEEATKVIQEEESNIIILDEEEPVDEIIVEEVDSLGDIFPDDSDEKPSEVNSNDFSDLDDIVAELDKEEDDDLGIDDFGDDGLPEL